MGRKRDLNKWVDLEGAHSEKKLIGVGDRRNMASPPLLAFLFTLAQLGSGLFLFPSAVLLGKDGEPLNFRFSKVGSWDPPLSGSTSICGTQHILSSQWGFQCPLISIPPSQSVS